MADTKAFTLRMPKEMHRQLREIAHEEECSINAVILLALGAKLEDWNAQVDAGYQRDAFLKARASFIEQEYRALVDDDDNDGLEW